MIKSYGDTINDGAVQLSFTLPVRHSAKADEAAKQYAHKLGFYEVEIVYSNALSDEFSFFVVYGKTHVQIDYDKIEVEDVSKSMDFYEVNDFIKEHIKRQVVVVGACTGTDAHTVGIDAIMNMKGFDQHYGLERYPMIEAYNLGAQVSNEELIKKAIALKADAILVSQVVTQKEVHIHNMTELIELMEAEGIRSDIIVIAGGPRIGNKLAMELGYDAGFGRGTYPENVASFIVEKMASKAMQY
ncbi:OAM dimerization domain-containing protein [Plebeiibacterium sediminum]|uniref:Cobalamin-dependent protein n=1 Tax=Plebeiibacterium sediminum TaxID=2992112 RepID=A0AAE3M7S8_9BACT|nr:OAM dimerization domain-containing protein [Plebeiobacterium sediminum]MCW3788125.1 cobalamin-dependent protein [Plebeiobacterium sediminum]